MLCVGCQEEHPACTKYVPFCHRCSFPAQVDEVAKGEPTNPGSAEKWPLNGGVGCCDIGTKWIERWTDR